MASELWEILVPTTRPNGQPIRTRFHRVWDEQVRTITGGLTILPVAKGTWTAADGEVFRERMIPCRIACSEAQIRQVIALTLEYYDQRAVMAYRVSDRCIIEHRQEVR